MSEENKQKLKEYWKNYQNLRNWHCKKFTFLSIVWMINKKVLIFGDIEIAKCKFKFHHSKYPLDIYNRRIDKIMISNNVSLVKKGFKYFIDYKDNDKVKLMCIILPNNEQACK